PHLVISGNSETWTPTLLECQATFPTARLRGNWDQEMAKCGATTHLPMVPRNCILFEIARAQRGRIVISAPNSLQLLCSQRRVPFSWISFLDSTRRLFGYFCPRQVCTLESRCSPERRSANRIA